MVTHHTASPITANPRGRSRAVILGNRFVVSRIAVMDQLSALTWAAGSLVFWRFHATRQRAEQNRACSRRGGNTLPHCSQSLTSATWPMLRVTGARDVSAAHYDRPTGAAADHTPSLARA